MVSNISIMKEYVNTMPWVPVDVNPHSNLAEHFF